MSCLRLNTNRQTLNDKKRMGYSRPLMFMVFCLSEAAAPAAEAAAPAPSWEAETTMEAEVMETKASMEAEASNSIP
jgi:hypothetical protein